MCPAGADKADRAVADMPFSLHTDTSNPVPDTPPEPGRLTGRLYTELANDDLLGAPADGCIGSVAPADRTAAGKSAQDSAHQSASTPGQQSAALAIAPDAVHTQQTSTASAAEAIAVAAGGSADIGRQNTLVSEPLAKANALKVMAGYAGAWLQHSCWLYVLLYT